MRWCTVQHRQSAGWISYCDIMTRMTDGSTIEFAFPKSTRSTFCTIYSIHLCDNHSSHLNFKSRLRVSTWPTENLKPLPIYLSTATTQHITLPWRQVSISPCRCIPKLLSWKKIILHPKNHQQPKHHRLYPKANSNFPIASDPSPLLWLPQYCHWPMIQTKSIRKDEMFCVAAAVSLHWSCHS